MLRIKIKLLTFENETIFPRWVTTTSNREANKTMPHFNASIIIRLDRSQLIVLIKVNPRNPDFLPKHAEGYSAV